MFVLADTIVMEREVAVYASVRKVPMQIQVTVQLARFLG